MRRLRLRHVVAAAIIAAAMPRLVAQSPGPMASRGESIAPAYEGWEKNADGSFSLVFGYMNRNWDTSMQIPIGPGNSIEPGGPDQGQPTNFLPRRNYYLFRVRVPSDFGDRELVWTLTSHGRTERAYATLRPGYYLNDDVMTATLGSVGPGVTNAEVSKLNRAPTLSIDGTATRSVGAGEAIPLVARADDDGLPKPLATPAWIGSPVASAIGTLASPAGLRVAWFVYRGAGDAVTFDPPQFKVYVDLRGGSPWSPGWKPPPVPADHRWDTRATFSRPGTYVLRCLAHDGALGTYRDVTVTVR